MPVASKSRYFSMRGCAYQPDGACGGAVRVRPGREGAIAWGWTGRAMATCLLAS